MSDVIRTAGGGMLPLAMMIQRYGRPDERRYAMGNAVGIIWSPGQ